MTKRKGRMDFSIALGVVGGIVLALIIFSSCSAFITWKRNRLVEAYRNGEGNVVREGYLAKENIRRFHTATSDSFTYLEIELLQENGELKFIGLAICGENLKVLQERGFFEAIENGVTVTMIINDLSWAHDNFNCPLFEMKSETEVYLDYETGLNNWIEYLLSN